MLGAPGLRSTPGTPPTAAKPVGTQHRKTASRKRNFVAAHADTAPRPTNTPHVTSYPLQWAIHRPLGVTILAFAVVRLPNRITHRPPPFLATIDPMERRIPTG